MKNYDILGRVEHDTLYVIKVCVLCVDTKNIYRCQENPTKWFKNWRVKNNHINIRLTKHYIPTRQSVLPLIKNPASSRSPTRSQTSLLVTECKAVTAPLWPFRTRTFVWIFFCAAAVMSVLPSLVYWLQRKQTRIVTTKRGVNHGHTWRSIIRNPLTNTTERVRSRCGISAKHTLNPTPSRSFCRLLGFIRDICFWTWGWQSRRYGLLLIWRSAPIADTKLLNMR